MNKIIVMIVLFMVVIGCEPVPTLNKFDIEYKAGYRHGYAWGKLCLTGIRVNRTTPQKAREFHLAIEKEKAYYDGWNAGYKSGYVDGNCIF